MLLQGLGEARPAVQRAIEQPDVESTRDQLVQASGAFAQTAFSLITVFLLTYYWLTERATIKRSLLRLVPLQPGTPDQRGLAAG